MMFVCFQNMTDFVGVTALTHEMGPAFRAQQRGPNASTQNVLHLCCLSRKIWLSAYPGSLDKKEKDNT